MHVVFSYSTGSMLRRLAIFINLEFHSPLADILNIAFNVYCEDKQILAPSKNIKCWRAIYQLFRVSNERTAKYSLLSLAHCWDLESKTTLGLTTWLPQCEIVNLSCLVNMTCFSASFFCTLYLSTDLSFLNI